METIKSGKKLTKPLTVAAGGTETAPDGRFRYSSRHFTNYCGTHVCARVGQHCGYPADYLVSIHSAYDIDMHDWAWMLKKHSARAAYLTMLFDPRMYFMDKGETEDMECSYIINRAKDTIAFYFNKDPSNAYRHKYSRFFRLISPNTEESTPTRR